MEFTQSKACIIALLLSLTACTKTVYQTTPSTDAQPSDTSTAVNNQIQNDPSKGATVPANTAAQATGNNEATSVATPNEFTAADVNAQIAIEVGVSNQDTHPPAIIGEPGEIVDCELSLPCRWLSANQDFTLTVGSVDNTGALDRLSIQYTVSASHDSELYLGNGSTALEPGGATFNLVQQSLGASNGIAPQPMLAGQTVIGSASYDRAASTSTLAAWTLTVVDNGLPRTVGFINLPIGTPDSVAVDCDGILPCQWESSQEDAVITLVAVGGFSANGRLNVNFNIVTKRDMVIVLDAGAIAIGTNAEQFDGRTHSLGSDNGFALVKATTHSGVMLPGNVSFFRTSQTPTALESLDLVIYEDSPTPRWNPQFTNLPTQ